MPCTSPREMWPPKRGSADRRWVSTPFKGEPGERSKLFACGQCNSCRLATSRDWVTRIQHEASLRENNCFVTLTYDDAHLPANGSLNMDDHQRFMKRLRKHAAKHMGIDAGIRFFMCGEYGGQFGRPHMHHILLGIDFADKTPWKKTPGGVIYRSATLETLWTAGFATLGPVNTQTIGYVSRYTLKAFTGDRREQLNARLREWEANGADPESKPQITDDFWRAHPLTGELHLVSSEFCLMSRNPGLGTPWLDKWGATDLSGDFVVIDGQKHPVPKHYVTKLDALRRAEFKIRQREKAKQPARAEDQTERRLITRHESAHLRAARLKRDLDEGAA